MLTGTIVTFFINNKTSTSYKSEIIEGIKNRLSDFDNLTIDDLNYIKALLYLCFLTQFSFSFQNYLN
jgi:hypothetical protein